MRQNLRPAMTSPRRVRKRTTRRSLETEMFSLRGGGIPRLPSEFSATEFRIVRKIIMPGCFVKSFIGFVVLRERPSSVETISGEDDVIEVSMDENSNEKSEKDDPDDCKIESTEKINFLNALGLITTTTCAELQNKRAERKRRSTANPQFVYSSLEVPTVSVEEFLIFPSNDPSLLNASLFQKRKRHSYLQSGNVPQTRQTTARMNGPSPPPVKVVPPKSTSPPTSRTVMKSLIPVQKSTTRPNILRSVTESKVFPNKNKVENGPSQIQLPVPTVKSVHSVGNKAVHIPGLPSSLTIERISSDSAVCISCRNPGMRSISYLVSFAFSVPLNR